jgi:hypothetical protein
MYHFPKFCVLFIEERPTTTWLVREKPFTMYIKIATIKCLVLKMMRKIILSYCSFPICFIILYGYNCKMYYLLVRTPDPHRRLHYVGWPSLSLFCWETGLIWAYFIVLFYLFELFMVDNFNWWVKPNNWMF